MRPPGSQHGEITRMHGFSDPAGSADGSRKRRPRYCLPPFPNTSAPRTSPISGLNSRPARTPTPTLRCALTGHQRMDGAAVESYSFDVGLFHSLHSCRLSGAFRKMGLVLWRLNGRRLTIPALATSLISRARRT